MPRLNIPSPEAIRHQQRKQPVAENRLQLPLRYEDDLPFLTPPSPARREEDSYTIRLN